MPRIRRAQFDDEAATTFSDLGRDSRSADFLKDPDLFKDLLPQPYRYVKKTKYVIYVTNKIISMYSL